MTRLHRSNLAIIEELDCPAPSAGLRAAGYTDSFHFVLPLSGSFRYSEGSQSHLVGPNQILVLAEGREYNVSHPVSGDRSIAVFPRWPLGRLYEALVHSGAAGTELRTTDPELRLAASKLLTAARAGESSLTLDELAIDLCQVVLDAEGAPNSIADRGSATTFMKAQEYLHAHFRDPLTLFDVASAVGITPVYLTQLFKRSCGMPLHQYLISLRLNEALAALEHAPNLTALALDLGFSSHSHFTSAFRARFGISPSRARADHNLEPSSSDGSAALEQRPLCPERGGEPGEGTDWKFAA